MPSTCHFLLHGLRCNTVPVWTACICQISEQVQCSLDSSRLARPASSRRLAKTAAWPRLLLPNMCLAGVCLLLLQVVYGVLRYSRFINAFLASFWDKNRCAAHT